MLWFDDTARNSNLFPVNANGLVRLRSPASRGSLGNTSTPVSSTPPCLDDRAPPFSICSKMSVSMSPRKIEMMAGGASFAPSRWSFPALAIVARRSPCQVSTARKTAAQKTRNCMLSWGLAPGDSRLFPSSSLIDQFRCLPDPFTPAKGFSCSRHASPNLGAIRRKVSITIIWWSVATLAFSKIGAISYWLGATSLCRVLTGTPTL